MAPSPTTTITTTVPPSAADPATADLPPLLVADADGIRVVAAGEVVGTSLAAMPTGIALPDLSGGVVYQASFEVRGC